jgi:hypothetical protein
MKLPSRHIIIIIIITFGLYLAKVRTTTKNTTQRRVGQNDRNKKR